MTGQTIIILVLIGFLMIAAEVFVPGMILGALGALCLIVSVILCYFSYGALWGTIAFALLILLGLLGFLLWLKLFPKTPLGKRMMLNSSLNEKNALPIPNLIGETGESLTPLRPAGTALLQGRRMDVVAESGLIEPGQKIFVVAQEGIRIVVRQQNSL